VSGIIKAIVYTVPSATQPGVVYQVAVNPLSGRPQSCTCKARRDCWHRKAVAAGSVTGKPRVRYGPKVEPVRPTTAAERMTLAGSLYA
jgi:hypothetical protein